MSRVLLLYLQHSTLHNLNVHGWSASLGKNVGMDILNRIHSLHNTAKGNEASIQLRSVGGGDEKSRVVLMDSSAEHRNDAWTGMGYDMRLIGDGVRAGVGVVAPRRPEGGVAPPTVAVETENVAHAKANSLVRRVIILIGYAG